MVVGLLNSVGIRISFWFDLVCWLLVLHVCMIVRFRRGLVFAFVFALW